MIAPVEEPKAISNLDPNLSAITRKVQDIIGDEERNPDPLEPMKDKLG